MLVKTDLSGSFQCFHASFRGFTYDKADSTGKKGFKCNKKLYLFLHYSISTFIFMHYFYIKAKTNMSHIIIICVELNIIVRLCNV